MGKKKVKTEQTTRPVYGKEIMGAYQGQQAAYNAAKPGIDTVSGNLMDLSGDLLGRFRDGDPAIDAAKGYVTTTLESDPQDNPYLDQMVDITNDSVRNQLQAQMGTRGQTGGSAYYDMIGRGLAQNESGLRYNDYDRAMGRKAQAAGMAPGIVAGEYIPVAAAMESGTTGAMLPVQAALANSAGVGGLLGQYTNQRGTQTQSGGFGSMLGGILGAGLSGWATGGFKI